MYEYVSSYVNIALYATIKYYNKFCNQKKFNFFWIVYISKEQLRGSNKQNDTESLPYFIICK